MRTTFEQVLSPKTGLALELEQGQRLRVTQIEEKQVVDMAVWNRENPREKLSTAWSRNRYILDPGQTYHPKDRLEPGSWLMSTLCRPLMTIVDETASVKGVHGSHHRMCNRFFYKAYAGEERDGCHEIISGVVASYGLLPEDVPDSFDLFQNYPHDCEAGHFTILDPVVGPDDYVEFRADMDLLVALSNCPEDSGVTATNAGRCSPVKVTVFEDENYVPTPVLDPPEWLDRELEARASQSVSAGS